MEETSEGYALFKSDNSMLWSVAVQETEEIAHNILITSENLQQAILYLFRNSPGILIVEFQIFSICTWIVLKQKKR
jgi:hypothetical protein